MVKVSRGQCTLAKLIANDEIEGGLKEHYARIWDIAHEILKSNPGSSVKVGVNGMPDGSNFFSIIYKCFKALKKGGVSCRNVIGLDGTFLKGLCKGELLTAMGRDANNQIYPIAWAVVEVENKKKHNGVEFRNLFWEASKTTLEHEFLSILDKIKSIGIETYDHLIERYPNTWSRAFFETGRACDSIENGISESFNYVIMSARRKPIITMLEEIRMFIMEWNYTMRKKSLKWEGFFFLLKWIVIPSSGNMYEVRDGYEAYSVDLDNRECSCRLWKISGIPCLHSTTAIYFINNDPEEYVCDWFKVEKFKETYKHYIKQVNGSKLWKSTSYIKPLPPKKRRMPGWPSIKRKRHETKNQGKYKTVSATGRHITCGNCGEIGHNVKTCTNEKKQAPPKEPKKKGRPRTRMTRECTVAIRGRGGRGRRGERGGRGHHIEQESQIFDEERQVL
ncbi:uncharacterized protein LOC143586853 [Bidens hawaiensis]|uniref:uncharacterized protein LOC143586853 n=1 Tax=Bidens hawaiensis TaxID=980011 RepID=UPI00404B18C8